MNYHIVMNYGMVETPLQIGQLDQDEALIIQRQLTTVARSVFADLGVIGLDCLPTYYVEEHANDSLDLHH
ncbi:hypothetical protein [Herpetosiphon giganteus]|uniref:hypothetical protein n=1 Tax=Herpetosiphon giganteus TaxID=2029754 RepID=UPI001958AA4B|nr:hypothetical protein [Herpetosiphon giganteus]MBM7845386.1 hypothetical protein [Herpetosiphon giganteus]